MQLNDTNMKPTHKAMILQMVNSRRVETELSKRLAVATFGRCHPTVGELEAEIQRLECLRVAVVNVAELAVA